MQYSNIVSIRELVELRGAGAEVLICDCRFSLNDVEKGGRDYREGHIPGAIYLDLEKQLSGPKSGTNGRHPLPDQTVFVRLMSRLGAGDKTQIVAYDEGGGIFASRLWWMMRWIGHQKVAVLDGGLRAWQEAGETLSTDIPTPHQGGMLTCRTTLTPTVGFEDLSKEIGMGKRLIVDARGPDRFKGKVEPIDPIAGHIPGAVNRFCEDNLDERGMFKPAETLKAEFQEILGGRKPVEVVSQCGSGVTACHNLLALDVAGLSGGALYPGSWSEWCARAPKQVEVG